MMIGDGFNGNEFWEPYYAFSAAGYQVEVASYELRPILCGNRSRDVSINYTPQLLLDEVRPKDYVAFFLPGGKGPENLEKYPRSLALCKEFNEMGILISSLCHGPRLLGQAGVMKGKMVTYLHKVRDEIPEYYEAGDLGYYQDLPLVKDGNLFTSRYPEDVCILTRATMEELGKSDSLLWPEKQPSVLIIDGGINKLETYAYLRAGLQSHADVKRVDLNQLPSWLDSGLREDESYDLLVILDGKNANKSNIEGVKALSEHWHKPVMISKSLKKDLKRNYRNAIWLDADTRENHRLVVQTAYKSTKRLRMKEAPEFDAYLAIEPDFDESAFLAMKTVFEIRGYNVGIISSGPAHVKSMNGLLIAVDQVYEDMPFVPEGTPIIDPGGLWPYEEPLEDYETAHFDWILKQWKNGAPVLTVGWGAYYLASMEAFQGKMAATSDQGEWSFGKRGGARYSSEPAIKTAPGLVTVKSSAFLKEGLALFFKKEDL